MVSYKKILLFFTLGIIAVEPVSAQEQKTRGGVSPEGRQAVLSGSIVNLDADGMTINHLGQDIQVDAEALIEGGLGDMDDYYDEGMFVTVEGTLTDEDEIAATRITRGVRNNEVPPYIVNNPGIIGADDLD